MDTQDVAAVSSEARGLADKQNLGMARVRAALKTGAVRDSVFFTPQLPRVGDVVVFDDPDFLDVVCIVRSITHRLSPGDPGVPDFIVSSAHLDVEQV